MKLFIGLLVGVTLWAQTPNAASSGNVPSTAGTNSPDTTDPNAKPPEKGKIVGQITSASTGEPLKKATISVYRTDSQNGDSATATTDAAGHYEISDLDPGKYSVSAQRNGYVRQTFGSKIGTSGGSLITLGPGGIMEAGFKLIQQSVVTGRVVDEDGEPVPHVSVQLTRISYRNGKATQNPVGSATTDDRGEYRIFEVAPGKYFLSATYNRNQFSMGREATPADDSYAPVYFPGTTDPQSATRITVPKSGEMNGMDIALQKVKSYRIRGAVISNVPGESKPGRVYITLMPKNAGPAQTFNAMKSTQTQPDGKFEFHGVTPGAYEINANLFSGESYVGRQEVTIAQENLNGVTVTIEPGTTLTGSVKMEGDSKATLSDIDISLEREQSNPYMGTIYGKTKDDGSFTLKNIDLSKVRLATYSLPEGSYVKRASIGSVDFTNKTLDLSTIHGGTMEIVLSPKGATADGSVKNDKDEAVTNGTVVLIPDTPNRSSHELYKTATLDQYGHYKITGVTPGSYSLFAFQNVERGIWEDPDYLKNIEKQGVAVSFAEGDQQSNDLKVIIGDEE